MAKYLDQDGLKYYTKKIKDGTIVAGKCLASGIQGVIDISHIPQGALERLVQVADDTARFKLTTAQVQLGDTVKVQSTGRMYIVVDESKLSSAAGYMEYTAGQAAQVPWSGVTGKPTTLGGYGITDAAPMETFTGSDTGDGLAAVMNKGGHSVLPFGGTIDSATIATTSGSGSGSVVFVKSAKTFAYCVVNGMTRTYFNNWEGRDKYNDTSNSNAPYTDKLYVNTVDGRAYYWDGTNLVVVYQADLNKLATAYTFATTNHHQTSGFRKLTTDAHGMVTGSEAVTKNDITALGIPGAATNDSALSTAEIDTAVAQATA